MRVPKPSIAVGVVLVLLTGLPVCAAVSSSALTGAIAGTVKDSSGTPQMGAAVFLYNRFDRLIGRGLTGSKGEFLFDSLIPDTYSLQATLPTFVPATRRNILIQPGIRNVMAISVTGILSSIELVSTVPNSGALMSDDWKWVLRSTMTTRPILRALGRSDNEVSESGPPSMFSDTTGLVKVSSGEVTPFSYLNDQLDLGTTFALATSLYGNTKLQVSGKLGYALNSATPSGGFRTSFRRNDANGPEIKLMMLQMPLPSHGLNQQDGPPMLRSMSLTLVDRLSITDDIDIVYGSSLDSVEFQNRLIYFSPFARIAYHLGKNGKLMASYSSGAPPIDLVNMERENNNDLERDVAALAMLPRVSMRGGKPRVQRTQTMEAGYELHSGARTYGLAVFQERVGNGALTMMSPDGLYDSGDLLGELSANSSVFNIGGFSRMGCTVSVRQEVTDKLNMTVAYGNGGTLRTDSRELQTSNPQELRNTIRSSQQDWALGKIAGVLPVVGTKFSASYQWTDYRLLTPGHFYLTQQTFPEPGLNIHLRQPIPAFPGMPGRLEATAEFRNMLAQGYLSMNTADGRSVLLTNSPRVVRGGLSFIF